MREWYRLWKSKWRPTTCENIIAEGIKLPPQKAVVGHGAPPRMDENLRRSTVRWIPVADEHKYWRDVVRTIDRIFREVNMELFNFDLGILRDGDIQFTEYQGDQAEHYDWHEDLSWVDTSLTQRKLSMVVQLSNPELYLGGDFQLVSPLPEARIVRRQGTVIVFPSFLRHRVTPVTSGVRYSLVAWLSGPRFR